MQKTKNSCQAGWLIMPSTADTQCIGHAWSQVGFYQTQFKRGEHCLTFTQNHQVNHTNFTTKEILRPNYENFYLLLSWALIILLPFSALMIMYIDYFCACHSVFIYPSCELGTQLSTLQGEMNIVLVCFMWLLAYSIGCGYLRTIHSYCSIT